MTEPTALIDTAAEFTEDAYGTPEDEQFFPEDWEDWQDEREIEMSYAGEGGEDAYLDSYWESLYEM